MKYCYKDVERKYFLLKKLMNYDKVYRSVSQCDCLSDSLESLYDDVERRRVKAIKADISGKADRA